MQKDESLENEKNDQQKMIPNFTTEQVEEKRQIYSNRVAEILTKRRIPKDEIEELIKVLITPLDESWHFENGEKIRQPQSQSNHSGVG